MKTINKDLLSNITILYIEDEKMIRDEVSYFFSKYVKNFHTATNGQEGLELYNQIKPDLIITDIQMPKMNGLDMIKEINNKKIPIIITTAFSDIDYFLKAIELNVSKFIIKPINLMELVKSIQECVYNNIIGDKLFEKENLLRIVDENVLISITDKDGKIIDASGAFCDFVEYSKEELMGKTHRILGHPDTTDEFYINMWQQISSGKKFNAEIKNRKKSGEIYWANLTITPVIKDNEVINYTAIRQDITNKKRLEQLAIEDTLTGVYNRRYFNKIIEKELRRTKRENLNLCLLSIDIDDFKKYNDTFGHPKGDEVLIKVAQSLKFSALRATDFVFRMGGEEFSILFSGLDTEKSLEFSNELVKKIENLQIEHIEDRVVTISAGLVSMNANDILDEEELYRFSDDALYEAKARGKNQVVLFEKE